MNEKQINLLKDNGYEVLSEFGFIVNQTKSIPIAYIFYDKKTNQFGLNVVDYTVIGNDYLVQYSDMLAEKIILVRQLNDLRD